MGKEAAEKVRERHAKEKNVKEKTTKEVSAKERVEKDRINRARESKEKSDRAKAAEASSKESSAKESSAKERHHKSQFLRSGQCCLFLYGCHNCCNRCPHGNPTCGHTRAAHRAGATKRLALRHKEVGRVS